MHWDQADAAGIGQKASGLRRFTGPASELWATTRAAPGLRHSSTLRAVGVSAGLGLKRIECIGRNAKGPVVQAHSRGLVPASS